MEEIGVVMSVEGPMAKVLVERKSACDKCTAGTCSLTGGGAELQALNEVQAEVGQKVRVALKSYTYVKGSMLLYGLPALSLIAGAVLGKEYFSTWFEGTDPDAVSAIAAFGFFALSFIVVKLWSRSAEKKVKYTPVIEEILKES
jgi:sigma-E factor negative regulatory protein RseC